MKPLPRKALDGIDVWRADELATTLGARASRVLPSGHAALDAELPGGGWPVGALIEVLQAQAGQGEWRLVLPALCALQAAKEGVLVLVGAPQQPFAAGLAGQGLDATRLLCVQVQAPAERLWATEQALRCKDVAAVLAWLPQTRADPARAQQLRRLQIAAAEHAKLLFVLRPAQAQAESSPALLRVLASKSPQSDALQLNIIKRRGSPLEQALTLVARPVRLGVLMALGGIGVRAQSTESFAGALASGNCDLTPIPPRFPIPPPAQILPFPAPDPAHALDRLTAAA